MPFHEHKIPKKPKPPPRPAWMDTSVVDPAWLKEHPLHAGKGLHGGSTPSIDHLIYEALKPHLAHAFDPLYLRNRDGTLTKHAGRNTPKNMSDVEVELVGDLIGEVAQDLTAAVNRGLEDWYDDPSKVPAGFVQEDIGLLLTDEPKALESLLSDGLKRLVKGLPAIVSGILDDVFNRDNDLLNMTEVIRSAWQNYIVDGDKRSDVTPREALEYVITEMDEREILDVLRDRGVIVPTTRGTPVA